MTFTDILGLWPFTLDEFVQALHDYVSFTKFLKFSISSSTLLVKLVFLYLFFNYQDSRLLGEVHIALLRLIVRDIEDVARTPSGGPGTNQYTVANPEGGHPQIVEGVLL